MPELRLQKTREAHAGVKPDVPACLRLGHLTFYDASADVVICRRCGHRDPIDRSRAMGCRIVNA